MKWNFWIEFSCSFHCPVIPNKYCCLHTILLPISRHWRYECKVVILEDLILFSSSSNKQFECDIRCPLLAHPPAQFSLDSVLLSPHDRNEDSANPDSSHDEHHHDLETEPTEAQKKICKVIKIYIQATRVLQKGRRGSKYHFKRCHQKDRKETVKEGLKIDRWNQDRTHSDPHFFVLHFVDSAPHNWSVPLSSLQDGQLREKILWPRWDSRESLIPRSYCKLLSQLLLLLLNQSRYQKGCQELYQQVFQHLHVGIIWTGAGVKICLVY